MGASLLDDFPFRAGVPKHWVSGLQKWEGPDPAFWCAEGYAVVNVDTRGAYTSEGDLMIMGHQEAQDGAEFVTWLSQQPWSNGKVGLTGNSWLAMSQWKIGSLRPDGLAALAPWWVERSRGFLVSLCSSLLQRKITYSSVNQGRAARYIS